MFSSIFFDTNNSLFSVKWAASLRECSLDSPLWPLTLPFICVALPSWLRSLLHGDIGDKPKASGACGVWIPSPHSPSVPIAQDGSSDSHHCFKAQTSREPGSLGDSNSGMRTWREDKQCLLGESTDRMQAVAGFIGILSNFKNIGWGLASLGCVLHLFVQGRFHFL